MAASHSPSEFSDHQKCLPRTSGPESSPLPDDGGEFHSTGSDESPPVNGRTAHVAREEEADVSAAESSDHHGTDQPPTPASASPESPSAGGSGLRRNGLPRKRAFAPRSTTGCVTCRQRKKKCDEGKPGCRNCARAAYVCEGYLPPKPPSGRKRRSASKPVPHGVPAAQIDNLPEGGATLPQLGPPQLSPPQLGPPQPGPSQPGPLQPGPPQPGPPQLGLHSNQNECFTAIEAALDPAWTYNAADAYQCYNAAVVGDNGGSFEHQANMGHNSATNISAASLFLEHALNTAFPSDKPGAPPAAATLPQGPQMPSYSIEEMLCAIILRLCREREHANAGMNFIL
ncbi:hypothetical protein ABW19_dt0200231 [Neofusicoccum parvum]|uniref:Uncharacterized protein n=1 Tax=Neofusicoccum parvum TaxID=310453 RepID=A0ACB5SDI4_9PEZI|nr:hypothetical protein ABW19_dt0200231 [Neofusicoccum parvum]